MCANNLPKVVTCDFLYQSLFTENSVATQKHSSTNINTNKIGYNTKYKSPVQRSNHYATGPQKSSNRSTAIIRAHRQHAVLDAAYCYRCREQCGLCARNTMYCAPPTLQADCNMYDVFDCVTLYVPVCGGCGKRRGGGIVKRVFHSVCSVLLRYVLKMSRQNCDTCLVTLPRCCSLE